ncbi:MAG TPA: AI-2E family transporter [Patescibacteria group bacterium]
MIDSSSNKSQLVNLSTWTILKVILILFLLWFVYVVRDILAVLFVAILLTSLLEPFVTWLQQKMKFPRSISVILIYVVVIGLVSLSLVLIIPPIVHQLTNLIKVFPAFFSEHNFISDYFGRAEIFEGLKTGLSSLESSLGRTATGVYSTVSSIFGGIISLILVLVITFYMTIEEDATRRVLKSVTPDKYLPYVTQLTNRIQNKLGLWLKGQLILSLILGIISYIGLKILGIEYALILAVLAGLAEFVPFLGPIIAGIPAVILAFFQEPIKAVFVIILYIIIQQVENHILVPKVMQKTVGLNPIIVIVALLVGAKLAGVLGALLAVPVATAIGVFIKDFYS